ncbi:hypothetical protein P7K49_001203 [Saguinus oedipus]|uniref:Uncharacterized protein n=1 Tax=Saguinus oedipus TaxID=9490 RepID=A0ABQ9WDT2_SAGOE|nr:hypothetical protein P7K49_001203 [Saguinus oedipus]
MKVQSPFTDKKVTPGCSANEVLACECHCLEALQSIVSLASSLKLKFLERVIDDVYSAVLETTETADDEEDQPLSLAWPSETRKQITFLIVFPIVFPLWITLPDVRKPSCFCIDQHTAYLDIQSIPGLALGAMRERPMATLPMLQRLALKEGLHREESIRDSSIFLRYWVRTTALAGATIPKGTEQENKAVHSVLLPVQSPSGSWPLQDGQGSQWGFPSLLPQNSAMEDETLIARSILKQ